MQYPDYTNGLVNLSNSILRCFGAERRHESLPYLDGTLDKGFETVVLMLFDGMGADALARHLPEYGFLRSHHLRTISSVFPPTTTAALTSLESGLTPMEHGWLGWSLYFKELDQIVELFPNTIRDSGGVRAADYHAAGTLMPFDTVATAIGRAGKAAPYTVSPFAGRRVTRHDDVFESVRQICAEPGRKYVYAYWNQPDARMHDAGCGSLRVRDEIRRIDQSVETMCGSLRNTLVIVTADHGHIDTRYRFVSDYPAVQNALIRPPAIESRAAAFYVKDQCKAAFPDLFHEVFADAFLLLERDEVVSGGLFGPGQMHPRFLESIGDFLAVAVADEAIAASRESRQFVSNHAGLTRQEMDVPLILIET